MGAAELCVAWRLRAIGTRGSDPASDSSVECASENYQYNECHVGHLDAPAMLQQSSHSACTWYKSWGYDAQTGYMWVGSGCAGTFGDAGCRHHESHSYRSAGTHQEVSPRPQCDSNGEPNFDTHGNDQGCHGDGRDVDTPPDNDDGGDH